MATTRWSRRRPPRTRPYAARWVTQTARVRTHAAGRCSTLAPVNMESGDSQTGVDVRRGPASDGLESFGALLQRHRLAAGLSQEELAERAGLSRRGISDLERRERRRRTWPR